MNMQNAGTVTPGTGSYYYGENLVIKEFPNPGYSFDGWYLDGVFQGKLSSIPITITNDSQLLATFSKLVVALTITANPSSGGTTAPGTGITNYTYGDSVSVKEFANSGYTFSGWYLDGVYEGAGTGITVVMNQDHQLNAFFSGGDNSTLPLGPTATPMPTVSPTPNPTLPMPILQYYCTSSTTVTGFNVRMQGELEFNGTGLAYQGLQFSYSVTGGATWQDLAYVITGDDGSFTLAWMPQASGNYVIRAYWLGNTAYSTVTETVNFAVAPPDSNQDVFSVASNSTITNLLFDSSASKLDFTVTGPSGTTGYVDVSIPKLLLPDISVLKVNLDGSTTPFTYILSGNVWLIIFVYHHSTHSVVMALSQQAATSTPTANPSSTNTATQNPTSNPSNTQTSSPTPPTATAPTTPEFSSLIIVAIVLAFVTLALVALKKRAMNKD